MAPNAEDCNADELEAPQWLNADYLTEVLCHCEKDADIEVSNFKLSPGTAKGDHYASIMFRAVVNYKQNGVEKVKSMIIKTMPETEGNKKEMFGESHIFETEIGMYTEVIPKFEEILRSIGDDTVFGANCIYYTLEPRQVIIFDDLCQQGYQVLRDRYPNISEVKLAYLKLAKWHAISYKILKEQPDFFKKYRYGIFNMTVFRNSEFMIDGLTNFIESLDASPALKEYKPYFEPMQGKLIPACQQSFEEYHQNQQEGAYYVLSHGDFHAKNMMFKMNAETGKTEDCMLLDFQMSYVGPIVNDVIYSFYMLLGDNLRLNNRDELIYYYFASFLETLKKIGYEGETPKLLEYRKQLRKHKYMEMLLLTTFLSFWYSFREGAADPDEMLTNSDARKAPYKNKDFLQEMESLLPKLLHLGYFEN